MSPSSRVRLAALAAAIVVVLAAGPVLSGLAAARLRAAASHRGLAASWSTLRVSLPARVALEGFSLTGPAGRDTVFHSEALEVVLDPWALLLLRARVRSAGLEHARLRLPQRRGTDADTLPPELPPARARRGTRERVQRSAEAMSRALLLPARQLPRLTVRDLVIEAPAGEDVLFRGARLAWLELAPAHGGARLRAAGGLTLEQQVRFEAELLYGQDDRLTGGATFAIPDSGRGAPDTLRLAVDGTVTQDRRAGVVRVADRTRVTVGRLPFRVSGAVSRAGPRLQASLELDRATAELCRQSLPPPVLGPLLDLAVRGSWDYRAGLDLDLARPDSVEFFADVIPHGLVLDSTRTRLRLFGLDQPFTATIHLPHGRLVTRELSPANPHYRPLAAIAPVLVSAVVTNEDGGFFRHRGFNPQAIRLAIAEDLKAGAFRRGAGTITMQLARNLYLGHDRTLSRKGQEVVLAWVLEHLTGLTKERLLEIYLNIIEWGPGIHGADEAARYYFDRDAASLDLAQALFLATVLPAPNKWRYRFDPDGSLRPFEQAQMHFIGRAMIAKEWLAPEQLLPADSLRVVLAGPARFELAPPDTARADSSAA